MSTIRRRKYILLGLGIAALVAGAAVVQAQSPASKDKDILAKLREAARARNAVPEAKRTPMHHPDKYSFPIGIDDKGKPFPVTK